VGGAGLPEGGAITAAGAGFSSITAASADARLLRKSPTKVGLLTRLFRLSVRVGPGIKRSWNLQGHG
jgi:hypothetical protein